MKTNLLDDLAFVFGGFLVAEGVLPWGLLWLSNLFLFEIPRSAIYLVVGAPTLLMLAASFGILLRAWPHRRVGKLQDAVR